MAHIAIQESLDGKPVDWPEKVSDQQCTMTASTAYADEQEQSVTEDNLQAVHPEESVICARVRQSSEALLCDPTLSAT